MNDKSTRRAIMVLIALLIAVVIDITMNVVHVMNYDSQKSAGNMRWQQVEERIIEIEQKVNELQK